MGDRALIVAGPAATARQTRLAGLAEGAGYRLAGIVADAADAWAAALAGECDVILVETDREVPRPLTPRFETAETLRRRAQEERASRRRTGRRPEILER